MKIFVTGGTGFVGTSLTRRLAEKGHEVTVMTRSTGAGQPLPGGTSYLEGDPSQTGAWQEEVAGHDIIINLAGASIFKRWTKSYKEKIRLSRILTTQNLVEALKARRGRETLFISTSAVGYYGFREDEALDEGSPPGEDFLAGVSQEWENSALEAEASGVRVVILRFGIVLGKYGGALKQMLPLFKAYLGSPLGSGKQWFSWIHEKDLINIYLYLMAQDGLSGPINCTAPNPIRNREMTQALGEVLGKPTFMPPVPGFMIRMVMGEFGSTLLRGQKALPKKLLKRGFQFQFPEIREALMAILG